MRQGMTREEAGMVEGRFWSGPGAGGMVRSEF